MREFLVNDVRSAEFFARIMGGCRLHEFTSLGVVEDGNIIGVVILEQYNGASIFMHVASNHPRWFTRSFAALVFGYCFDGIKVKRITAPVEAKNRQAVEMCERLGFEQESVAKGAAPDGGDFVVFRMFKEQCVWLRSMKGVARE